MCQFQMMNFRLAEELIKVLKPLKDVTTMLCSKQSPTVSMIMPLKHQIIDRILVELDTDIPAVRDMKSLARDNLKPRYKDKSKF